MVAANNLHLRITAGPSYDASTHNVVAVNTDTPIKIHTERLDALINVRIQNYRGLPSGSPSTCEYFSNPPHTSDLYSISFSFNLKKSIPATDLLFGNDFDFPIRDSLPPGFNTALRLVKWVIDPGIDGDVYADRPYLYGALASSINTIWVGDKKEGLGDTVSTGEHGHVEEGGSESGKEIRAEKKIPAGGGARAKHFLNQSHKEDWIFEAGREYKMDFYNHFLDFNDLALRLPLEIKFRLMDFWDGQPLRYSLKHRNKDASVDELLFVVVITLVPKDEVDDAEEKLKEQKEASTPDESTGKDIGKKADGKGAAVHEHGTSAINAAAVGQLGLDMGHANKDFGGVSAGGAAGGPGEGSSGVDDGGVD